MSDFDPVEIRIDFQQNVDTEGKKATEGIDDVAASSARLRQQLEKDIAAQRKVIDALTAEIKQLQAQIAKPVVTGDDKAASEKAELAKQIDLLNKKLVEQEAIIDRLRAKQGAGGKGGTLPGLPADPAAYAKGMGNLSYSIQQVARELPTLALSPQMFILAISNNLPTLQDQINKTRLANEALKKANQATVPVWKQVLSSILSWQTAMVVGITVLTLYGKEISEWVGKLFKGKAAIDSMRKAHEELVKTTYEGIKNAQEEKTKLDILYRSSVDTTKSMKERNAAVDELQKMYPYYFGNMDDEAIKIGAAEAAYNRLTTAIIAHARAKAYLDKITENQKKILEIEQKANKQEEAYLRKLEEVRNRPTAKAEAGSGYAVATKQVMEYTAAGKAAHNVAMQNFQDERKALMEENALLEKQIKVPDLVFGGKGKKEKDSSEDRIRAAEELSQSEQEIELAKNKALLQLMDEGLDKRKALGKQAYDEEMAQLDKQEKDYVDKLNKRHNLKPTDTGYITSLSTYTAKTPSDKGAASFASNLNDLRLTADRQYVSDVEKLDRDAAEQRKKIWSAATAAFLNDIEKEKAAINEKYDNLIQKATEEGETQAGIDRLNEQRTLELLDVQSKAALKLSSFYQQLYGDIDSLSARSLRTLREQLDAVVQTARQVDKNGQTFIQVDIPTDQFDESGQRIQKTVNMTIEEFQRLKESGRKLDDAFSELRPFEALLNAFRTYNQSNKEVQDAQQRLTELQQSGTASTEQLAQATEDLANAEDGRKKSLSDATKSINKIGTDGQKLVGAGQDVVGMLEDMGVKVSDSTKKGIEGVGMMMDGLASIDLTNPVSIVTGAVKFTAGLVKSVVGFFGGNSAKKAARDTAELNRIASQTEAIYEGINKLLKERIDLINEAAGAEAAYLNAANQQTIEEQKQYLKDRFDLLTDNEIFGLKGKHNDLNLSEVMDKYDLKDIEAFIAWYNSGGYNELLAQGYTWTNEDSWASIIQSWNDLTDASEESAAATQEALTGISFDELKDSLDDLIQDVDTTWADVADSFEEHMQDAVLNFIKKSYLTDALREWYDTFADYYASGNEFTAEEKAKLEQLYKDIYNTGQSMYDAATSAAGIDTSSDTTRTGSTSGIAQASQDSVDELNGRMTAIQAFIYDIKNMNAQSLDFEREAAAYQASVLSYLDTIADNTSYCRKLVDVDNKLNDIILKGIKIKQ